MSANPASLSSFPPPRLTLLDSEPGAFSIYLWQNVTIVSWAAPACEEGVRRVAVATEATMVVGRKAFSNVHIIRESTGVPSEQARAGLTEMGSAYGDLLACVGVVLLGSGFWASARQSAITGMRMGAPRSYAFRIEGSLEAIAAWLVPVHQERTLVTLRQAELLAALSQAFDRTVSDAARPASGDSEVPRSGEARRSSPAEAKRSVPVRR